MTQPRVIEQLRRKLSLLVEHGHFANLDEIAEAIGTTRKTLEGWADYGSNKVTSGLVPKNHWEQTIGVFTDIIRKHHGDTDHQEIIKGSVAELSRYLSKNPRFSFFEIVEREAINNSAKISVIEQPRLPAVKRFTDAKPSVNSIIKTNQWFSIEYETDIEFPYVIALQNRGRDWSFCDVEYIKKKRSLVIPGLASNGSLDFIQESDWDGINAFYALQSRKPWPLNILKVIQSNAPIGRSTLQSIADHFMDSAPEYRSLHVVKTCIQKAL